MQIIIYLTTLIVLVSAGTHQSERTIRIIREKQSQRAAHSSTNAKTIQIIKQEHRPPRTKTIQIVREYPPEIQSLQYLQQAPAPPPIVRTVNILHQPPPPPPTLHQYSVLKQFPPPPPVIHSYNIVKHRPPPPAIVNTISVIRQPSAIVVAKAIPFVKESIVQHSSILAAPAPPVLATPSHHAIPAPWLKG